MLSVIATVFVTSCNDDNNWNDYKEWREANVSYFDDQKFMMEDGVNV